LSAECCAIQIQEREMDENENALLRFDCEVGGMFGLDLVWEPGLG